MPAVTASAGPIPTTGPATHLVPVRASPWCRLLLGSALGLCLAACTEVGPDDEAPRATLAAFHAAGPAAAREAAPAPALDHWWTGFEDPELTRIVRRALDQNLDLEASLARVDAARATAAEAGAQLLPSTDATASSAPARHSLESPIGALGRHMPGFERNATLYDAGLGASWELDLFGGLRRGAEAAEAEAEAAEADHLGVRILVAADAADAYLQIRADQTRLLLAQSQIGTDAKLRDLVGQLLDRGAATDRELAQAEALLEQAEASVPPLRVALEAQLDRLDVLMGAQPGTYAAELATPGEIPVAPRLASVSPTEILQRRPDIRAAERELAAANARIGVATAAYYPTISLSGLLGFESMEPGRLFQAATFQPQAVAGLRWRLFDFGRVDAEVAQATGARRAALAQYRATVLHAAEDVENALTALVQDETAARHLTREVEALDRARIRSEEAYRGGAIGLTDVLDADRELLAARDALARTRADAARAAVASFRAIGGGW